ncbi:MAG TPA: SagB family peptide dehydrogenase [Bacilli bacterium]|nr:SagB family peptide dehydrogenase [Bacilli bacterium]
MSLDSFLYLLHYAPHRSGSSDWEVDWSDAPLSYKLYRHLPVIPLSAEVPLTLEGQRVSGQPELEALGHFLAYSYGVTRIHCTQGSPLPRRYVPSGGGLFPSEVYVYLKLANAPHGVYHYDAAHHRLVLLREGNFDGYLGRALGERCELSDCFGVAFVSTVFWKNFFKYNNFAYRLQGADAGVLIGQLLEVAKRFGFETGVYFQFLDRAVNHLLGLAEQEESVYAILPLSVKPQVRLFAGTFQREAVTSGELCQELPVIRTEQVQRSKVIRDYSMLTRMNEASLLESTQAFQQIGGGETHGAEGELDLHLPDVRLLGYDLAEVCRKRFSPGESFAAREVGRLQVGALLRDAVSSFNYCNDLDDADKTPEAPRVNLYGCVRKVKGIPDGAYAYDRVRHGLRRLQSGDLGGWLQTSLMVHNLNLAQIPLHLHVAGDRHHLTKALGKRGYRIAQMEAGLMVQRLLIAATALDLGGHPLLGFDAGKMDYLYDATSQGRSTQIYVPIGRHRASSEWRGMLR